MVGEGKCNIAIITTGLIAHSVVKVAIQFHEKFGYPIDVIDVHQIKPIKDDIIDVIMNRTKILVVEESYDSILAKNLAITLSRLGSKAEFEVLDLEEKYYFSGSSRSDMERLSGISINDISASLRKMIGMN